MNLITTKEGVCVMKKAVIIFILLVLLGCYIGYSMWTEHKARLITMVNDDTLPIEKRHNALYRIDDPEVQLSVFQNKGGGWSIELRKTALSRILNQEILIDFIKRNKKESDALLIAILGKLKDVQTIIYIAKDKEYSALVRVKALGKSYYLFWMGSKISKIDKLTMGMAKNPKTDPVVRIKAIQLLESHCPPGARTLLNSLATNKEKDIKIRMAAITNTKYPTDCDNFYPILTDSSDKLSLRVKMLKAFDDDNCSNYYKKLKEYAKNGKGDEAFRAHLIKRYYTNDELLEWMEKGIENPKIYTAVISLLIETRLETR